MRLLLESRTRPGAGTFVLTRPNGWPCPRWLAPIMLNPGHPAILLAVGPDGYSGTGSTIVVAGSVSLAGPSIAGVLMTALVDGKAGFHRLGSRLRRWRVGARWYAVALLTGPLVMCGTVFGLSVVSPDFRPDIVTADDKLSIVVVGIAVGLMVGFFEELGWTGFAQPRPRYGILSTGLGMGFRWGVQYGTSRSSRGPPIRPPPCRPLS